MARVHLRLSDDEFFRLTPRQLRVLLGRHREETYHAELLAGVIASAVANFSMGAPKKPVAPAVFMPSQWGKPKPGLELVRVRFSRKAIATNIRCFLLARAEGAAVAGSE